jgi:hypothetical protein
MMVGYGDFKIVDGKMLIRFMGSPCDFCKWEVNLESDEIVKVLEEKCNGKVEILEDEGLFAVYSS